jgi:hypothetical protein
MKTQVLITIDTEFSVGGAFVDPERNRPVGPEAVFCEVGGRSHGLGFLLDTFAEFGTKATFFVEALNTHFFGDAPMGAIARRIRDAGQDVQLHLHPCWTYFERSDWRNRLRSDPPSDHMHSRSVDTLTSWMQQGISAFERWGIARPVAMRTGSMMADRNVYSAMESVGLPLASNIGLAVYRPADPALHLYSGVHRIGGITEAPVLTYADLVLGARTHLKSLTVTGTSFGEARSLLDTAQEEGVETVVLLTHPFEFVKYTSPGFGNIRPNGINQDRLRHLCRHLADNADRFETVPMGGLRASGTAAASGRNTLLRVPVHRTLGRILENRVNSLRSA